jgi:protein-L-isoaspartate(D-aspartate) O-methyltransferase
MNLEQARFNMIEQQIRPWDVLDPEILRLLAVVKREDFVPAAHKSMAFVDMEIPLGHGQHMLAPRVEARLLQDLHVKSHEKVLEIGSGSGYFAALLAHRAQSVVSVDISPELATQASQNLQRHGIHNVQIKAMDASTEAIAELGAFDVIVLSGSVAEVPASLLKQLKVGGRLAAIVGEQPMMRACVVTRMSEGSFQTSSPWDTVAPRLKNFAQPSAFRF